jgi:uncharacterized protein YndB with AHSA1/START domain
MADDTHSFESSAEIAATPAAVWAVLVDAGHWSDWDSGVESVTGSVELGKRITIVAKVAAGRSFPVKVTTFEPGSKLVFTGGMPLGLFKGVRTYTLTPSGTGTRITMREVYSGAMLGAIWKSIPDLNPSFAQFVNGLKAKVESGA